MSEANGAKTNRDEAIRIEINRATTLGADPLQDETLVAKTLGVQNLGGQLFGLVPNWLVVFKIEILC